MLPTELKEKTVKPLNRSLLSGEKNVLSLSMVGL